MVEEHNLVPPNAQMLHRRQVLIADGPQVKLSLHIIFTSVCISEVHCNMKFSQRLLLQNRMGDVMRVRDRVLRAW